MLGRLRTDGCQFPCFGTCCTMAWESPFGGVGMEAKWSSVAEDVLEGRWTRLRSADPRSLTC